MDEMKLIMENWRKFEKGSLEKPDAGSLCLFEGRRVRRVPFVEALNSIGDTEKELDLFLEKWEKSLDYELKRIDEVDWKTLKQNPVLGLSTQVFLSIEKAKDNIIKYASEIISGANKIKAIAAKFESKNPKIYKTGTTIAKVATAFVVLYTIQSIFGTTDAMAGDMTQFGQTLADSDQLINISDQLNQSGDENLQKISKVFRAIAENPEDTDMFGKFGVIKDQVVALAQGDVEQLKLMATEEEMGEAYTEVAKHAVEIFGDVQDIQIPEAPEAKIPTSVSGEIGVENLLDQIEMKILNGESLGERDKKILNYISQGPPKTGDSMADKEMAREMAGSTAKAKDMLARLK